MPLAQTFKNIFRIKELRDRILLTFGLLIVFRLGSHILLPGLNPSAIAELLKQSEGGFFDTLQAISASQLGSLFSFGIMPYITASIIMSLLTKVNPRLEAIAKEGPSGHRKINQYTRMLTIPICLVQGFMVVVGSWGKHIYGVELVPASTSFGGIIMMVLALLAGAVFVMWLGEQITEHGIGNGASMLIMAGIIARLPRIVGRIITEVQKDIISGGAAVMICVIYVSVIVFIVFITQSQRRIPVQHAKMWRGRRITLGQRNYLPLKVNQAGVMPVIFASALMGIPYLFSMIPGLDIVRRAFERGDFIYSAFYVSMIFFFSYFWTFLFFPPDEMANNLKEYGSFIPGIRPGHNTAEYLDRILRRITLLGAAFLCAISLLPDMSAAALGMNRADVAFLGGTGILIIVGVSQDVVQKIESYLLMHNYAGFMGEGTALRGRR